MNVLPGSSCGVYDLPDTVLAIEFLYAGGALDPMGQSLERGDVGGLLGLASSCGPLGLTGGLYTSSMFWFRSAVAASSSFFACRLRQKNHAKPAKIRTFIKAPITAPAMPPLVNEPGLAVGWTASSYRRVKTWLVIKVTPVAAGVAGTSVSSGRV